MNPEASTARGSSAGAADFERIGSIVSKPMPALDGIRGIAILSVLLFHIAGPFRPPNADGFWGAVTFPLKWGWAGVDLFFVLSGFLITGILLDTRSAPNFFRSFYMRRMLRIIPLYYGFLLLWFTLVPRLAAPPAGREPQAQFWLHVSNWIMPPSGHLAHLWSLAVEEQFYLVWPLVVYWLSRRRLLHACIGMCVLSLALRTVLLVRGVYFEIPHRITPARVDSLMLGAIVAIVQRDDGLFADSRVFASWVTGVVMAALFAIVAYASAGFEFYTFAVSTAGLSILAGLFAWVILKTVESDGSGAWQGVVRSGILRSLGKYSYGMYVFHYPLNLIVLNAVTQRPSIGKYFALGWPVAIAYTTFMIAATYALASLSWHLYERRFLTLKDRFAARPRGDATTIDRPPALGDAPAVVVPPSAK